LLGALNRLILNRHVGLGRPGFPEAHDSLAGQQRPGAGVGASHSEGSSRRPGAARQQEDQRGRAGSRSERAEEGTPTDHGHPRAGLLCASDQFAARNLHLLAGQHHSLLGRGLCQLLEWTLAGLFNFGHWR
jgi:hypothetical protein